VLKSSRESEAAEAVARDVYEYLKQIDYQQYYDSMGRPGSVGGQNQQQFYDFSLQAVKAAKVGVVECG
jgi:hypothetical protein